MDVWHCMYVCMVGWSTPNSGKHNVKEIVLLKLALVPICIGNPITKISAIWSIYRGRCDFTLFD